ncbi:MAG: molecular chaperone TorD family protein [Caldimicrobium sp.]
MNEIPLLRSKIFYLISRFFLQRPDKEFIKQLINDEFIKGLELAFSSERDQSEVKSALNFMVSYLKKAKEKPLEDLRVELGVDFTKLLRGVKKGYGPPPPYESVWKGEGQVMGMWTEKVLNFYSEAGLGMDLEEELPDYIGIELKFLSILSYHEAEALQKGNLEEAKKFQDLQKRFLETHLTTWAFNFLDEMEKQAETDFYKGVAKLTKAILKTLS